jgi:hypothetical protein
LEETKQLTNQNLKTNKQNMKKYRIVETIFKNERKEFMPQLKTFFGWRNIGVHGSLNNFASSARTYNCAQERIDLHFEGNTEVKKKGYYHQYKG